MCCLFGDPVATQCSSCDLISNLWLCLTCGLANCGRQQHGGVGGNGHAKHHYEETGHMVAVKLGTITAEGTGGKVFSVCNVLADYAQTSTATPVMTQNWI